MRYFTYIWNQIDCIGLVLVFIILLGSGFKGDLISYESLRILAAFGSQLVLIKLFDWLRIFDGTAFYVLLIWETIYDIRYFFLLLLITLTVFGIPLIILDGGSADGKEVIDNTFGYWLLDLMYNQYLLTLGEFNLDNFDEHPQHVFLVLFFTASTFISQITMLNMLIAIMGDSYSRVIEHQDVHNTMMQLEVLHDCSSSLPQRDQVE